MAAKRQATSTKSAPKAGQAASVEVDYKQLKRALAAVSPVGGRVSGADQMVIEASRKALTLTAGKAKDRCGARVSYRIPAKSSRAQRWVVRMAELKQVMPGSAEKLTITAGTDHVTLKGDGSRTAQLATLDDDTAASSAARPAENSERAADPASLLIALRGAIRGASRDSFRPILSSVLLDFDAKTAVSSDSYILVRIEADLVGEGVQMISLYTAKLLARELGRMKGTDLVRFHECGHDETLISCGPLLIRAEAPTGKFPDWRDLLDMSTSTSVKLQRETLVDFADAARVAGNPNDGAQQRAVIFKLKEGRPIEAIKRLGLGSELREQIEAEIEGEEFEIGLDPERLKQALGALPDGALTMRVRGPLRPVLLEAENGTALVMPIRLG